MDLSWGRRYLMCPPEHFGVDYEINPWMHLEIQADREQALAQWVGLKSALERAGAEVKELLPQRGWPDLVFTANAGVVQGQTFVPAHFTYAERQGETEHNIEWAESAGFDVALMPSAMRQEGAGDFLPLGDGFLAGWGFRSDENSVPMLAEMLGAPVHGVHLIDPRMYHLDLTYCPLDSRHAIVAPDGWDPADRDRILALIPEPLILTLDEALLFCANSVVVGRHVLMPSVPLRIGNQLTEWGFTFEAVDVSQFLKAGGACRCLTLALDVPSRPAQLSLDIAS